MFFVDVLIKKVVVFLFVDWFLLLIDFKSNLLYFCVYNFITWKIFKTLWLNQWLQMSLCFHKTISNDWNPILFASLITMQIFYVQARNAPNLLLFAKSKAVNVESNIKCVTNWKFKVSLRTYKTNKFLWSLLRHVLMMEFNKSSTYSPHIGKKLFPSWRRIFNNLVWVRIKRSS